MSKMKNWMLTKVAAAQARKDEEGQGLAEYGLILALIAVACIVALRFLGTSVSGILNGLANSL